MTPFIRKSVIMAEKQEAWKKFKAAMKQKRTGKKNEKEAKERKEEIVVQRLSSEVSGKAQKYLRVGPREFVHVGNAEELTFESIQKACLKHFFPKIGRHMYCDILAGEQGPSCSSLKQIPDMKLIHIRFTEKINDEPDRELEKSNVRSVNVMASSGSLSVKRECQSRPHSLPSPPKKKVPTVAPKSLSVTSMLMLGKVIDKPCTLIDLYSFNIRTMLWSTIPIQVQFDVSKELLSEDAFRNAYKAVSSSPQFSFTTWVIKRYKPEAIITINATGQSVETHSKKVIQMHCLAKNLAQQLKAKVEEDGLLKSFGATMQYGEIYLGKDGEEYVTIEEFVEGSFTKYINNDGQICGGHGIMLEKAECLSHFSFDKSNGELILVDIQGCGYHLFDPEIASSKLFDDDKELLYTAGNLSMVAISNFASAHVCNTF